MAIQIQVRRGTAAQWTAANTILASGELGLETDTIKWKYGDGATAWAQLPYASVPPGSIVDYAGAYNPATTYHSGEYVVGADGITYQCVKDNTVGQTPAPWAPAPMLSYATTLPGSPVDGQEAILVDSTTNPSYQWRFRYNAGSSSAYKWEYVGGIPARADVSTSESTTSATWVELTTPQRVTVPRAGLYDVGCVCTAQSSVATDTTYSGVNLNAIGSPTVAVGQAQVPGNNASEVISAAARLTLAANDTLIFGFIRPFGTGSASFLNRSMWVTPARVS